MYILYSTITKGTIKNPNPSLAFAATETPTINKMNNISIVNDIYINNLDFYNVAGSRVDLALIAKIALIIAI